MVGSDNMIYSYKLESLAPDYNEARGDGARRYEAVYGGYTYSGEYKGSTSRSLGYLHEQEAQAQANEVLQEMNVYAQRKYQDAKQKEATQQAQAAQGTQTKPYYSNNWDNARALKRQQYGL